MSIPPQYNYYIPRNFLLCFYVNLQLHTIPAFTSLVIPPKDMWGKSTIGEGTKLGVTVTNPEAFTFANNYLCSPIYFGFRVQ